MTSVVAVKGNAHLSPRLKKDTGSIIINTELPKEAKAPAKAKPTDVDHQAFLDENHDHWLIELLRSSGKLKANKSGIGLNSTPLSWWQNLLEVTRDKKPELRKVQLMVDGEVLLERDF